MCSALIDRDLSLALYLVVLPNLWQLFVMANLERRRRAFEAQSMVPCGTYGCTKLKREGAVFCIDCRAEYREDPDAFK